jgi:hypothetical protein
MHKLVGWVSKIPASLILRPSGLNCLKTSGEVTWEQQLSTSQSMTALGDSRTKTLTSNSECENGQNKMAPGLQLQSKDLCMQHSSKIACDSPRPLSVFICKLFPLPWKTGSLLFLGAYQRS